MIKKGRVLASGRRKEVAMVTIIHARNNPTFDLKILQKY
jgi:hypothetical protein